MAKNLGIICSIQDGKLSILFHVADTVEGNAKGKLTEMLNDLPFPEEVIASLAKLSPARLLSSNEVEVQDVPQQSVQQSKSGSDSAKKKSRITDKQLETLRDLLAKKRISESSFCAQHKVARLEELTSGTAWHILDEWLN